MNTIINPNEISLIRNQVNERLRKEEYSFEDMIFIYEKSREILYWYNSPPKKPYPLEDLLFWHSNILDMKEFVLTYETAVQKDAELVMDIIEYTKNAKDIQNLRRSNSFMESFDSRAAAQKVLNVIRILLDVYAEKGVQSNEYKMWLFYYNQIAKFLIYPPRGYAVEDVQRMTLEEAEFFQKEVLDRMIAEIDNLEVSGPLAYVYVNLANAIPILRAAEKANS